MSARRHRLQVAMFPFLSVLLCVLGSLILLMLVLDRKVKLAAAEQAHQQRLAERDMHNAEREKRQAERRQLADQRAREAEEQRRAEEERLKKEQDEAVRQHLAQLQTQLKQRAERREQLRTQMEKLKTEESTQLSAIAHQQAELASLTDDLRKQQEEIGKLSQSAETTTAKIKEAETRRAQKTQEQTALAEQMRLLEQVIQQVKAANQQRPPLFYLFPPNKRTPGAGRPPIYLECVANHAIFRPGDEHWTGEDLQSGSRFVDEVTRRMAAKGSTDTAHQPYLLLIIRPSGVMLYYVIVQMLQGADIDMGYELVAEDWKIDFTDPQGKAPAEVAKNRTQIEAAEPPGPRGVAPKIYSGASGVNPGPNAVAASDTRSKDRGGPGGSWNAGTYGPNGTPGKPGHLGGPPAASNAAGGQGASRYEPPSLAIGTSTGGPGGSTHGPGSGAGGSNGPLDAKGIPGGPYPTGSGAADPGASGASPGMGKPGFAGGTQPGDWHGAPGGADDSTGDPARPAAGTSSGRPPASGKGAVALSPPATGGGFGPEGSTGVSGTMLYGGYPGTGAAGAAPPPGGTMPNGHADHGSTTGGQPISLIPTPSTGSGMAQNVPTNGAGGTTGGGSGEGAALASPIAGRGNSTDATGGQAAGGNSGTVAVIGPSGPHSDTGAAGTNSPGTGAGAPAGAEDSANGQGDGLPSPFIAPRPVNLGGDSAPRGKTKNAPRMVGGVDRDWVIVLECSADGVALPLWREAFDWKDLSREDNPLLGRLQNLIRLQVKRQPDVRPALKYRIHADGLRTYYQAARDLEPLALPATAERVLPDAKTIPPAQKK